MIRHHPDDSLLMKFASGSITRGHAVVVGAHVERCSRCHHRYSDFEALGGVLLDQLEPVVLSPQSLDRTLQRINAERTKDSDSPPVISLSKGLLADLPPEVAWPRALLGGIVKRWRRLGPGVRWSRVTLPGRASNLHLFRVAAGKGLPVHGHRGGEVSMVLCGAYIDGTERFGPGDFVQADDADMHKPVVTRESECICLVSVDGHIAFNQPLIRVLGGLLGI